MRRRKENLKTAKGRTASSARWLNRQINDLYVQKARKSGFRSRASFKLLEIFDAFPNLANFSRALDLGSSPGGWSQVLDKKAKANKKIYAVDLLPMDRLDHVEFLQLDFIKEQEKLLDLLGNNLPLDLIVSDMAPSATGDEQTDHIRLIQLGEEVLSSIHFYLKKGGNLIMKISRGGEEGQFLSLLKKHFEQVKSFKPNSSRKESREIYAIACRYKNLPDTNP